MPETEAGGEDDQVELLQGGAVCAANVKKNVFSVVNPFYLYLSFSKRINTEFLLVVS